MMNDRAWILLAYKLPRYPTAGRVYVWRKLTQLGAILLHGAIWVLPMTDRTKEQTVWLATEIKEMGGKVSVLSSQFVLGVDEADLVSQFSTETDRMYRKMLTELERRKPDVASLARRYQQVAAMDYFSSGLGEQVRRRLMAARGGKRS
jgi:hypothetical protein